MRISLCIPICDRKYLEPLRKAVKEQNCPFDQILLLDSATEPIRSEEWPLGQVRRIPLASFDHGGTRRLAFSLLAEADCLVFLTQDALPAGGDAIRNLVDAFADPEVGAAFGRQLPRPGAAAIEAHARLFNYPAQSRVATAADIPRLGIKAAFISNSFAAYRRIALADVGGFPACNIVSEDTLVAARMLLSGWKIAYRGDARVYHSHCYTPGQEFRRYFDIGVFHARQPWIRQTFGTAEKEGRLFVASELSFLVRRQPVDVFSALIRLPLRYLGFRAGLAEGKLPPAVKGRLSMQANFWRRENEGDHAQGRGQAIHTTDSRR